MRTMLRALIAFALLSGFYAVALGTVALDFTMLVYAVLHRDGSSNNVGPILVASVPLLIGVFAGVFASHTPGVRLPGSVPVTEADAPELWADIRHAAEEIGVEAPTEVLLTAEPNARAHDVSYFLGLVPGPARRLYLGVPLLVAMSVDELRAVLCHELGHFARGHTRLAAVVHRGAVSLDAAIERLGDTGAELGVRRAYMMYARALRAVFSVYGALFMLVASAVNRRTELEADAVAHAMTPDSATADALRTLHASVVSWAVFLSIAEPLRRAGKVPEDPFVVYRLMTEDMDYRDEFARLRADPPATRTDRFDTHPSVTDRLAELERLGQLGREAGNGSARTLRPFAPDPRPALSLFTKCPHLVTRVGLTVLPSGSEPLSIRTWVDAAAASRSGLHTLNMAGLTGSGAPGPLSAVLDHLDAGRSGELAVALGVASAGVDVGDGDPVPVLIGPVLTLIGQYLVDAGAASWKLSWTAPSKLILVNGTLEDLLDLVVPALRNPLQVPRLRLHLAALGVDADGPLTLDAATVEDDEPPGRVPDAVIAKRVLSANLQILAVFGGALAAAFAVAGLIAAHQPSDDAPPRIQVPPWVQVRPEPTYQPAHPNPYPHPAYPLVPARSHPLITTLPQSALEPGTQTVTVTVRAGDSLASIAGRCLTTVGELRRLNNLGADAEIHPGQVLEVSILKSLKYTDCP